MTSKLEALKKYLVTPGTGGGDMASPTAKQRKKKKKLAPQPNSLRILDVSEVLPAPRRQKDPLPPAKRGPRQLAIEEDDDEDDADAVFVEEGLVEQAKLAARGDVDTSGIRWRIQHHRRTGAGPEVKREEVKKEEVMDSDSDLSVPRLQPRSDPPPRPPAAAAAPEGRRRPPPPPRGRHDSDSDLSVPRAVARTAGGAKPAEAKEEDKDEGSDLSPPRGAAAPRGGGAARPRAGGPAAGEGARKRQDDSDSDLSPPRGGDGKKPVEQEVGSDLSPPRARPARSSGGAEARESVSDAKRRRHDSDSDLSPTRAQDGKRPADQQEETVRMSSGLSAGLVRGQDLKLEAEQVRNARRAAVEAAPDQETGRGATTVYRNRQGVRIEREEWVEQQQKKRKKKVSEYPEQELEWGGGIKQQFNKEADMAEVSRIAAQPFARYEPDTKYMEELKGRQDWNDPMRNFEAEDAKAPQQQERPKCPHGPWPNRFDILPGYRWDGKVRGNGYERRWLETKNHREFLKREEYKYEMMEG